MDRLAQMTVFAAVVEREGFTAAAEHLGIAKSTVSRRITELEERLGVQLLHRTTRVIRPTEVGRAYYERCAAILADVDDADQAVVDQGGGVAPGTLRLAASELFARMHLMEPIATFGLQHPEVRFELLLTDRYVDLVEEGVDLALRVATQVEDSRLGARRLASIGAGLFAAPAYLDRVGRPASEVDLAGHPFLMRQGIGPTLSLLRADGTEVRTPLEPSLVCNQTGPVLEAALRGMGVAFLPDFISGPSEISGALERVLPDLRGRERGVYAVVPHRRLLSGRVRAFVEHLAARWDPPPWVISPPA